MKLRVLPVWVLLLMCLTMAAMADVEIKRARYGNTTTYKDVTGIVSAYLRNNTLSFPVNPRSMGGDPGPGTDFLYIVYRVNGREFEDTVPQGGIFTFKGLANVQPVRPALGIPILPPSSPLTARLVVANKTHKNLNIYNVDRFGRWVWTSSIAGGQALSFDARVGEQWIVADYANRILTQDRINRGDNRMVAEEPEPAYYPGGYPGGFRKGGKRY